MALVNQPDKEDWKDEEMFELYQWNNRHTIEN